MKWRQIGGFMIALTSTHHVAAATGDAVNGQQLYERRCVACHSVNESRVGPKHRGVFGRKAGSVPDYDYSSALKKSRIVWSDATINKWLENPEKLIPGQKMGFLVPSPNDRSDLTAYLKTLSIIK